MLQRVADFHRAVGQLVAESPTLPEQSIRDLRVSLLREELLEFQVAHKTSDLIEMADALADICYIIAGTMVSYGIGPIGDGPHESPYDRYLPHVVQGGGMEQLLNDCFEEYLIAEHGDNLVAIDLALMTLQTSAFGVAWRLNIPLNAVFAEVHRSNMTKLLPDGSVLRRADGKIVKPPHWSPPDIAAILAGK
jgi:predicted HAD superfamily Cof-like phosphohydrolase